MMIKTEVCSSDEEGVRIGSNNPHSDTLDELLFGVMSCAEKLGINLWLECGTLLGFVRDRDYIPWEDDLDFGAFASDISARQRAEFSEVLTEQGYQVIIYDSYWHIAVLDSACHADVNLYKYIIDDIAIVPLRGPGNSGAARIVDSAIRIVSQRPLGIPENSTRLRDIARIRLRNMCQWLPNSLQNALVQALEKLLELLSMDISWRVPIAMISSFHTAPFRNTCVRVPSDAERYLAFRYGNDWRTPRQAYDTWKEDGAIV